MKKYILIQNDGEIEPNSFELIGASTKRGDNSKIGFFGSGLKYSIAYLMRNGIDFRIFSGTHEFVFTTVSAILKDQQFDRICINGQPTSFTVSMGPTWKEDWFVLREIYCNAIDEGSCTMVKETEEVNPSEGKTRIYIEQTSALKKVCDEWDSYFSDDREPIFVSDKIYTCYLGHEDGSVNDQNIKVYHKTGGILYRKGIRVYKKESYLFDYGCDGVNVNEDRTAKNPDGLGYGIRGLFVGFFNEAYIKSVLRTANDEIHSYEYLSLSYSDHYGQWSSQWVEFSKQNLLVVREISARYSDEMNSSKMEVFMIPASFARALKKNIPEVIIMGMGNVIDGESLNEIDTTPKMNYLLKEVMQSLSQMKYYINYDIKVAEFTENEIMGCADVKNKTIYISAETFDKGRREIALTLMEENEHIKSQQKDETRAFQTHIFSQWLKTMEEANGLFL